MCACARLPGSPKPAKPASSVSASKATSDSVTVSWQQTNSFRSVLIRYHERDSRTTAMCEEQYDRPRSNSITVFSLSENTDYEFYVAFVNSAGCSASSGPLHVSTVRSGKIRLRATSRLAVLRPTPSVSYESRNVLTLDAKSFRYQFEQIVYLLPL